MFSDNGRKIAGLLLVIISLYAVAYLLDFWQTLPGMTPVLDGAENIKLANSIYDGSFPVEPFYRAMLYPAILSLFRYVGIDSDALHFIAGFMGILTHILTSFLMGITALRIWKNQNASLLAMFLYGFHPPAVFFAAEPLDITAGLFFLTAALLALLSGNETGKRRFFLASGLLLGIGSVLRANMLPMAGIFVVFLLKKDRRQHAIIALIGLALPMLTAGGVNYAHSGQFRIMPWQGAYSLYEANKHNFNGRYFQQTLYLPDRDPGTNPARLESEILYFRSTGQQAVDDIDAFNRFWRSKTIEEIMSAPMEWFLLMGRKLWYLVNNFEQYNNKTFTFHKSLSPVLRYNPLCFGFLLVLAVVTLVNVPQNFNIRILAVSAFFMASGIIAFFVSDRFRILLLPFMIPAAAGTAVLLRNNTFSVRKTLTAAAVTFFLSFNTLFSAAETETFNADRLLYTYAAARLHMYDQQLYWADEVLKNSPDDIQAIRMKLVAFTNLALSGKINTAESWKLIERELKLLRQNNISFADILFIDGCYYLAVDNNKAAAVAAWQKGLEGKDNLDLFLAALIYSDVLSPDAETVAAAETSPFLQAAIKMHNQSGPLSEPDQNDKILRFLLNPMQ